MDAATTSFDPETGIRVLIKPTQSSFFAGEPFSVSITFINTHPLTPTTSLGSVYNPSASSLHYPGAENRSNSQPILPHHARAYSYSQSALPSPTLLSSRNSALTTPTSIKDVPNRKFHHKRGAHSISSAPLARPPTSPGTPRSPMIQTPSLMARAKSFGVPGSSGISTAGSTVGTVEEPVVTRMGLIGMGTGRASTSISPVASTSGSVISGTQDDTLSSPATSVSPDGSLHAEDPDKKKEEVLINNPIPELIEQRRKRQLGKSLSVSVVHPNEFDAYRGVTISTPGHSPLPSPGPNSPLATNGPYSSLPSASSNPKRTHTLALSQTHPHVRKHSVVDGDAVNSLSTTTPGASTSSLSLSLNSIAEGPGPGPGSGSRGAGYHQGNTMRSTAYPHAGGGTGNVSYPNTPMVGVPYIEPGSPMPMPGKGNGIGIGIGHPPAGGSGSRDLLDVPSSSGHPYPYSHHPYGGYGEGERGGEDQEKDREELILYSYAQLLGQVRVTPGSASSSSTTTTTSNPGFMGSSSSYSSYTSSSTTRNSNHGVVQPSKEQMDKMREVREGLLKKGAGGVVGGGSMEINARVNLGGEGSGGGRRASEASSHLYSRGPSSAGEGARRNSDTSGRAKKRVPSAQRGHERSTSLTANLFALLSPGSLIGFEGGTEEEEEEEGEVVEGEMRGGYGKKGPDWSLNTAPPGSTWTRGSGSSPLVPSSYANGNAGTHPKSAGLGLGLGIPGSTNGGSTTPGSGPSSGTRYTHQRTSTMVRVPSSRSGGIAQSHSRRSSISNFFGFGGGSEQAGSEAGSLYSPHSSISGGGGRGFLTLGGASSKGGLGAEGEDERRKYEYDSDVPLPTLETQPAMLAVDLALKPGEEKSYTYTLILPDNLPPTFRGKSLKFSYELVVGLCRAGHGKNNISKLMKVPIRLYNCVFVDRPQKPYNLLWPIHKRTELAKPSSQAQVVEKCPSGSRMALTSGFGSGIAQGRIGSRSGSLDIGRNKSAAASGSLEEVRSYARRLMEALPPRGSVVNVGEGSDEVTDSVVDSEASRQAQDQARAQAAVLRQELKEDTEEALDGCREAVEILTRIPKKASYDVTKDGVKVAVLTFSKSSFRLGETVSGVVELNEGKGRSRVMQLSAFLEAHESLPSSIAPPASNRHLKRTYAEHYSSALINTLRTNFSLDIPSDASPAFKTCIGEGGDSQNQRHEPGQYGGVEWKVRFCLLVAIASETSDVGTEGVRFKSLVRNGPRGEWGSSWKALEVVKPLEKPWVSRFGAGSVGSPVSPTSPYGHTHGGATSKSASSTSSWAAFFASYLVPSVGEREYHDGDEIYDSGDERSASQSRSSRDGYNSSGFGSGGLGESGYGGNVVYDGVKPDFAGGVGVGVDFEGGEEGWREVKIETVECEIPVRIWPGNTAFRAMDVVFEV